jgi:hypothetical protein
MAGSDVAEGRPELDLVVPLTAGAVRQDFVEGGGHRSGPLRIYGAGVRSLNPFEYAELPRSLSQALGHSIDQFERSPKTWIFVKGKFRPGGERLNTAFAVDEGIGETQLGMVGRFEARQGGGGNKHG